MKIVKDTTYVIRSSGYEVEGLAGLPEQVYRSGLAEDVIVAFRVIRVDKDGAVTLIWREIQRKKGLKLATR